MINLQEIQRIYKINLCDKKFHYLLENDTEINIVFYEENLCHLLGIQHVFNNDKKYLGRSGYNKIVDNTLTTKYLKNHNEKGYNSIKIKLSHFNEIYDLMQNCQIFKFYQERCYPRTQIRADFVFYSDENEYLLQLFAIQERDSTQYSPTSFIVKTKNDKYFNQYIHSQEYKKIKEFYIETLNNYEKS